MRRLVDLTHCVSRTPGEGNAAPVIVKAAESISQVPLDRLVTLATLVDLTDRADVDSITRSDLSQVGLAGIDACLLRTDWCDLLMQGIGEPAPILAVDAAAVLLEAGVRTIAADFPITGAAQDLLLHNGCVLVYCLSNLASLDKPVVRLVALPLKVEGVCCAEARVIAIEE